MGTRQIIVGTVIVTGVVVVGFVIKEALDAYELKWADPDDFDIHSPHSQRFFARVKLPEIKREKVLAEACGYKFVVGVRSPAHKAALLGLDPDLTIVVVRFPDCGWRGHFLKRGLHCIDSPR